MTGQLPLALRLASHAVLETFVVGANGAALAHLRVLARGEQDGAVWLAGPAGSGKSHALQAACREAGAAGKRAMYLPLRVPEAAPELLANLDAIDFLALDDIDRAAGIPAWEERLFEVLNSLASGRRALLIAAGLTPAATSFALPDLASRAAGAVLYRLQPLGEEDQIAALMQGARHRGLELDPAAARFLQSRVPRDMHALGEWLERLDAASLAAQRRVTVPFVRSLLAGLP
ncbi:MAG TPA: DnaA regulatory inactivator Hda [Gammaproteobacteria bacterium]|nr:DnaA regulatory inactivator Hda [Gammaproteobacteria bacterium]